MSEIKVRGLDEFTKNQLKELAKEQEFNSLNSYLLFQLKELVESKTMKEMKKIIDNSQQELVQALNAYNKNLLKLVEVLNERNSFEEY